MSDRSPLPRPPPLPLSRRADSTEAAVALGTDLYYPHHLRVLDHHREVRLRADTLRAPGFTIGTLSYSAPVRVDAAPYVTAYEVNLSLGPPITTGAGSSRLISTPATAAAYRPDVPTTFSGWQQPGAMLAVKIERQLLESAVASYLGWATPRLLPLRLALRVDSGAGAQWFRSLRRLASATRHLAAADLQARLAEECAVHLVAATTPELDGRLDPARTDLATACTVDRAVELMEAAPGAALTLGELADYVGVSGRTLQLAFRREKDTTPLRHLKAIRLERARSELEAPGCTASVADVARGLGFAHLGRFAAEYRAAFGYLPSHRAAR